MDQVNPPTATQLVANSTSGAVDDVLDIHGLAAYLKVSWRTVQEWDLKGLGPERMPLPGRLRRWQLVTVDAWLAAGCPARDSAASTG